MPWPANRLAALLPGGLRRTFFCNSGAEAAEGGVKLAKRYATATGKRGAGIVALDHSFHGRLALSSTLSGGAKLEAGLETFANVPGVVHAMAPYCYLCPLTFPQCGLFCPQTVERALDQAVPGDAAAVLIEPVLGVGGIIGPPAGYHAEVQRICRERQVPLILDEVFTGFGRTGRLFAAEHCDLTPDILLMGKALGGGLPLAGFSTTVALAAQVAARWHSTTFGGNPTACAAGLATLEVLLAEGLPARAADLGEGVRGSSGSWRPGTRPLGTSGARA